MATTGGIFSLITYGAAADIKLMSKKAQRLYYITRGLPSCDRNIISLIISRYHMKNILFEHYQSMEHMHRLVNGKINYPSNVWEYHNKFNQVTNYQTLHSTS